MGDYGGQEQDMGLLPGWVVVVGRKDVRADGPHMTWYSHRLSPLVSLFLLMQE